MPVYDYRCQKCGCKFERIAKVADPDPACPNVPEGATEPCGGPTKKIITATGSVQFKGGGWAADGYHHQVGPFGNDLSGIKYLDEKGNRLDGK